MKISYDHEVDALYILFKEATFTTKHLAEGIPADYDAEGRLAGIEILDCHETPGRSHDIPPGYPRGYCYCPAHPKVKLAAAPRAVV